MEVGAPSPATCYSVFCTFHCNLESRSQVRDIFFCLVTDCNLFSKSLSGISLPFRYLSGNSSWHWHNACFVESSSACGSEHFSEPDARSPCRLAVRWCPFSFTTNGYAVPKLAASRQRRKSIFCPCWAVHLNRNRLLPSAYRGLIVTRKKAGHERSLNPRLPSGSIRHHACPPPYLQYVSFVFAHAPR